MELKHVTVDELMRRNAAVYSDKTAIEFMGITYTWRQLDIITDHLASFYLEYGVREGTHVGIFSTNSINWVCTFLALAKIGAVSVLINFNYKYEELLHGIKYAGVEYLCYGEGFKETDFSELIERLRQEPVWKMRQYINIGRDRDGDWYIPEKVPYGTAESYQKLLEHKRKIKSSAVLSMIFTSGTTAEPKGVLLTQYQMLNVAREAAAAMHWSQEDRTCLALSLFHCFGLSTGLLANLVTGGEICLLENFRSQSVLRAVEKNRCTVLNGVPSLFLAILNNPGFAEYDLSSLRSGIIAGAGIRRQDYYRVKEAFGYESLQQSYGQTEASPSITFSGYSDSEEIKAVSVGKVIPNVELRIADPDTGEILQPGVSGEVQVQGFNVMEQGYYRKAAETKKAFTRDGWLKTGDLGMLDDAGNLYITGRSKDVIIRCGENISPKEVEEAVLEYPAVENVIVFGVEEAIVQEEVAACIIWKGESDEAGLRSYLKEHIANYKIPKYMYGFEEFPLHSNGKLNKKLLIEEAAKRRKKEDE